ncbi:MAG: hypothetical protein ACYC96_16075 [Fimbriimonadaceae bacterium]
MAIGNIQEYEKAFDRLVQATMRGVMVQLGLAGASRRMAPRHRVTTRNVLKQGPVDFARVPARTSITFSAQMLRNGDLAGMSMALTAHAMQFAGQAGGALFESIRAGSEAAGTASDEGGASANPEMVLEAMDRVKYDFDADDNPIQKEVFCSPEIGEKIKALWTAEHTKRANEILKAKRIEWLATKRIRKMGLP